MDAGFRAHLSADGVRFDADDAVLLRTVDEAGSLNRAADALGRSYSRAHQRLTQLEAAFGPLVTRQRGGSGGGGSELTDEARDLLARFDRLRADFTGTAEVEETVLPGRVVARDGELATVETDAGNVRALVHDDARDAPVEDVQDGPVENARDAPVQDAENAASDDPADATEDVQVAVRADTVTLHDPADAPAEVATSARNRFEGRVVAVGEAESLARVTVDVGAESALVAIVTTSSVEKLGLEAGKAVVASLKATATRASPREN